MHWKGFQKDLAIRAFPNYDYERNFETCLRIMYRVSDFIYEEYEVIVSDFNFPDFTPKISEIIVALVRNERWNA